MDRPFECCSPTNVAPDTCDAGLDCLTDDADGLPYVTNALTPRPHLVAHLGQAAGMDPWE